MVYEMKLFLFLLCILPLPAQLPLKTTFKGEKKFHELTSRAVTENWRSLPIGERTAKVGMALRGIPYQGFTLEIDNHIEAPSVNFNGLDCWTFFETSLCFARMLEHRKPPYRAQDLLNEIEKTRYFGGTCKGNYLGRIHYLVDWYSENTKRKVVQDLTHKFPVTPIPSKTGEMSRMWKHYRYLKHNPELRPLMAKQEARLNRTKRWMVPQEKVASIEKDLRSGDLIGIARNDGGSFCSHVGIIIKDQAGRARFLHASSTYKKVLLDAPLAAYLQRHPKQAGAIIARPQ